MMIFPDLHVRDKISSNHEITVILKRYKKYFFGQNDDFIEKWQKILIDTKIMSKSMIFTIFGEKLILHLVGIKVFFSFFDQNVPQDFLYHWWILRCGCIIWIFEFLEQALSTDCQFSWKFWEEKYWIIVKNNCCYASQFARRVYDC